MIQVKRLICVVLIYVLFESVAPECQIAQSCVTDFGEDMCAPGQIVGPNLSVFGCCPGCQIPNTGPAQPVPDPSTNQCAPPANCLPNGKFAPVQCKGDLFTGRCFCSDENGARIFGQMWRNEGSDDNMTCACSRRRSELEGAGRSSTLHCSPTGDYEPLQCDDGMCWCANPKTGQPVFPPVAEVDMKWLPCYSALVMGEQYLRRCESLVTATAKIHQEQSEHGTNFLGNPTTFCDYDGSYGPYQIFNGIAYCTGRDGQILGAWQTVSSEMTGMNCNCARDSMIYFPEKGMTMTEVCLANGNYRPHQNVGDVFYCVDTDGYHIELLDAWPTDNCASYAAFSL